MKQISSIAVPDATQHVDSQIFGDSIFILLKNRGLYPFSTIHQIKIGEQESAPLIETESKEEGNGSQTGTIVGAVLGILFGIALLVGVAALVFILIRKKRRRDLHILLTGLEKHFDSSIQLNPEEIELQ